MKILVSLCILVILCIPSFGQSLSNINEYIILEKGHTQRWKMNPSTFGWEDFAYEFGTMVGFSLPSGFPGVENGEALTIDKWINIDQIPANTSFKFKVWQGDCLFCDNKRVVGTVTVLVINTKMNSLEGCENQLSFNRDQLDSYQWAKSFIPENILNEEFLVRWDNITSGKTYFDEQQISEPNGTYQINAFTYPENYAINGAKITGTLTISPQPFISLRQEETDLCLNENSLNLEDFIFNSEGTVSIEVFGMISDENGGSGLVEVISTGATLLVPDIPDNLARDFLMVSYTTELNGCQSESVLLQIILKTPAQITFTIPAKSCLDGGNITLKAEPAGGSWSGTAVSGNIFDPSIAGEGTYTISYTYTGDNQCKIIEQHTIKVEPEVEVDAGKDKMVCKDSAPFTLVGNPANGTWSGLGIVDGSNAFDPRGLAVGDYQLTYEVTGDAGCSGKDYLNITIAENPKQVEAGPNLARCLNDSPTLLSGQSPVNGIFEGPGISNDGKTFDPEISGEGSFTISYKVTNENGCSSTDTRTITVHPVPFVEAGTQLILCENSENYDLSNDVSPSGGTFTGNGVNGNIFQPGSAGSGVHEIIYTYTNPNGCTNSDIRTIIVDPSISVYAGEDLPICEGGGKINLEEDASPNGGVWSGTGIVPGSNTFNPEISGVGTFIITYSVISQNQCTSSDSKTITVINTPVVDAGKDKTVCTNSESINLFLEASPQGGVFNGPGVENGMFNPDEVGPGTFRIEYSFGNPESDCQGIDFLTITVFEADDVSAGKDVTICSDSDPINLLKDANPKDGVWSGSGIVSGTSTFNPEISGVGNYALTYSVTNPNQCTSSDSKIITVLNTPAVEAGKGKFVCTNSESINLFLEASPQGGTFKGPGVENGIFNPEEVGPGTFRIEYSFGNPESDCQGIDFLTITIFEAEEVSAGSDLTVCQDSDPINLYKYASPSGGSFTGPGVSDGIFYPAISGEGIHEITYSLDNGHCTSITKKIVTVLPSLNAKAGSTLKLCENEEARLLTGQQPSGGTWSGPGIIEDFFDPSLAGSGVHEITYSVDNKSGCTGSEIRIIEVLDKPIVNAGNDLNICVNSSQFTLNQGNPANGTWSGSGILNGNIFNPQIAGVGDHIIEYSFVSNNGCISNDSIVVNVVENLTKPEIITDRSKVCLGDAVELEGVYDTVGIELSWYKKGATRPFDYGNHITYFPEKSETIELIASNAYCQSPRARVGLEVLTLEGGFFTETTEVLEGDLVEFRTNIDGTSYFWDFGDGFGSSTEKSASYYYFGVGSYTVTLTVGLENVCENEFKKVSYIHVKGNENDIVTSLRKEGTSEEVKLHPIPLKDKLNIRFPKPGNYHLTFRDTFGRKIHEESISIGNDLETVLFIGQKLPMHGTFLLQIHGVVNQVFKIIK